MKLKNLASSLVRLGNRKEFNNEKIISMAMEQETTRRVLLRTSMDTTRN